MARVFSNDLNAQVFGEFTPMNSQDSARGIRLDPPEKVRRYLTGLCAPLVVVKPLVESQNALSLLAELPNLKIIWLYRDFQDVVASNLKKFGENNGIDDLRPIMSDDASNWRSEKASTGTRELVRRHFSEGMDPADASALFWLARNRLYFEQRLNEHPDVLLVDYHDLVASPEIVMRNIYRFLGREYPGNYLFREVHSTSLGKGKAVRLSPKIQDLCSALLDELNDAARPAMAGG